MLGCGLCSTPVYIPCGGGKYAKFNKCVLTEIQFCTHRDVMTRKEIMEHHITLKAIDVEYIAELPIDSIDLSDYSIVELLEEIQERL